MHPAKINLGIHPVWSESWLSVWRNFQSLATHCVHWSDCGDAHADLNLCCAHRSLCWFCHAVFHLPKHWDFTKAAVYWLHCLPQNLTQTVKDHCPIDNRFWSLQIWQISVGPGFAAVWSCSTLVRSSTSSTLCLFWRHALAMAMCIDYSDFIPWSLKITGHEINV